jgi:protein transport protein SEC23
MLRADVTNTLTMIQPNLVAYSFTGEPQPVTLDSTSITPDRILLLDTFLKVIVFHGETIANWRKQNYQDQPEYASFRALLEMPVVDAQTVMLERFPHPEYINCNEGDSEARHLLTKLNPSSNHNNDQGGTPVLSDDVDLDKFTDHLKKLAVSDS